MKSASSQIRERILSGEDLLFLISAKQKPLEVRMVNAVYELIDGIAATPDNDVAGILLHTAQFLNKIGDRKGYYRLYALALEAQPGGQKSILEWINIAEIIVAHTMYTARGLSWSDATTSILSVLPEVDTLLATKPGRDGKRATVATRIHNLRKNFEKTARHPEKLGPIKNKDALQTYSVGCEKKAECKGDKDALERSAKNILLNVKASLQSFHSNPAKGP